MSKCASVAQKKDFFVSFRCDDDDDILNKVVSRAGALSLSLSLYDSTVLLLGTFYLFIQINGFVTTVVSRTKLSVFDIG